MVVRFAQSAFTAPGNRDVPERGSIIPRAASHAPPSAPRFFLAAGALLVIALPLSGQTLYGGNGNGGWNPGFLVTIDQTNGAGAVIGDPVTPGGLSGIAFGGPNLLYGSTIRGFASTSTLVSVNPDTGALVSTIGAITIGPTGPAISIGDLAWNPVTGQLYGIRSNADQGGGGGQLYTIDTSTGVATFVGNTGAGAGGGIAFSPAGALYQTAYNSSFDFTSLNVLNPADASRISTTPIPGYFDGLAVRPADGLLFASPGTSSEHIYTIDPGTGNLTLIGTTSTGGVSDLDFRPLGDVPEVPEPGSLALLAGAIPALAALRRRRVSK